MTGAFKGREIFNCLFVIKTKSWLQLLWIAGNNSFRTFTLRHLWSLQGQGFFSRVGFSLGCSARSAIKDPLRLLLSLGMRSKKTWDRMHAADFACRQSTRKKHCYDQNASVSKRRYLENLWRQVVRKVPSGQINVCLINLLDLLVKLTLKWLWYFKAVKNRIYKFLDHCGSINV